MQSLDDAVIISRVSAPQGTVCNQKDVQRSTVVVSNGGIGLTAPAQFCVNTPHCNGVKQSTALTDTELSIIDMIR